MPIYDFQCQSCGAEVEVLQKISDAPLTDCEACGESTMKKKVSAAAFRLSGSGWYETDFKPKKKDARNSKADDKPAKKTKEKSVKAKASPASKSK